MTDYIGSNTAQSLFLQINGIKQHLLHYPQQHAQKVLFLHGHMDCAHSFQSTIEQLTHKWDVYALDWRGFGLSDWQQYGYYDRMSMISDLKQVLQIISPNKAIHVVGHSMGGMLAAQLAGLYPQSMKSLVMAEGAGLPDMTINTAMSKMQQFLQSQEDVLKQTPRSIMSLDVVCRKLQQKNPLMNAKDALFMATALTQKVGEHYYYRADPKHHFSQPYLYHVPLLAQIWENIQAPVLWIEGENLPHNFYLQTMHPLLPERQKHFHTLQQVIRLKGTGHLMHWEDPTGFAKHLEIFWEKNA